MNVAQRDRFFSEAYRVLKKGSFFAFTEHGLGPLGNPIFPLPWADTKSMSYLLPPEETILLLKKTGFTDIEIIETGDKYMSGYEKLVNQSNDKTPPTLGIHVIGGPSMIERSKNSLKSIKEKRTLPFEILCKK
jgi:hypothetical protein